MPQQKLFSQEVELMGSAVLNAAGMPMKVKKMAFLSNTRGRMAFAHSAQALLCRYGR